MMFKCLIITLLVGVAVAYPRPRAYPRPQQIQQVGLPPHLLRQYLAEAQQQRESTPIYEAEAQAQGPPQPQGGPVTQFRFSSPVQRLVERVQQPQYPQTVQYPQPAPQAAGRPRPRPLQGLQQQEEEEPQYPDDPNPSYQFGFDVNDDQFTNYQNRKEQRDGNVIKGSYSVVDSDGFIRTVTYTADPKEGFKAEVTRQPTDIVVKIPTPKPQDQQIYRPQQQQQQQQQPQPQREQQPQQYYRYQ